MKRGDKKGELEKTNNYKNIITQFYDRDTSLNDVKSQFTNNQSQISILDKLNQFERTLDTLIKKYDVQQMYMRPPNRIKRIIRIKATRDVIQGQQILKIYGYVYPKRQETNGCKLTSFIRQIAITNGDRVLLQSWKKPTSGFSDKDGLVIKLPGTPEDGIVVHVTLIHNPPRFEVDPLLQKVVGMRAGTRVQVLDAFWLYVKNKKLQDVQNKQIINCDDLLRQTFKADKLTFATINQRVRELLMSVEPIRIIIGEGQLSKTVDAIVQIQQRPNVDIVPFFSQKLNEQKNQHPFLALNGKIKKFENKFRDHTQKLRRHLAKRQIYKNFNREQIQGIVKEQHKLLQIMRRADPSEEYNRLEYILQNQDELLRQIKHYLQGLSAPSRQQ